MKGLRKGALKNLGVVMVNPILDAIFYGEAQLMVVMNKKREMRCAFDFIFTIWKITKINKKIRLLSSCVEGNL